MKNNLCLWFSLSALVICILTLGFVIASTMSNQREVGYLNRVLEENLEHMAASESNIELYRVYVESLRQTLLTKGLPAPPLPEIVKVQPVTTLRKERLKQTNK